MKTTLLKLTETQGMQDSHPSTVSIIKYIRGKTYTGESGESSMRTWEIINVMRTITQEDWELIIYEQYSKPRTIFQNGARRL